MNSRTTLAFAPVRVHHLLLSLQEKCTVETKIHYVDECSPFSAVQVSRFPESIDRVRLLAGSESVRGDGRWAGGLGKDLTDDDARRTSCGTS